MRRRNGGGGDDVGWLVLLTGIVLGGGWLLYKLEYGGKPILPGLTYDSPGPFAGGPQGGYTPPPFSPAVIDPLTGGLAYQLATWLTSGVGAGGDNTPAASGAGGGGAF